MTRVAARAAALTTIVAAATIGAIGPGPTTTAHSAVTNPQTTPAAAVVAPAARVAPAAPAATTPIKHVILVLLENHSFDNILGPWCVQNNRCNGIALGTKVHLANGGTPVVKVAPDIPQNMNHERFAQERAWHNGADDGWWWVPGCSATQGPYICVEAYQPSQVFTVTALASQFAVSDATDTCDPVASWADHFEWMTGCSLGGFYGTNPTKNPSTGGGPGNGCPSHLFTELDDQQTRVPSCFPDYNLPKDKYPYGGAVAPTPLQPIRTLAENCDATAGCTWKQYGSVRKTWGQTMASGEKNWGFYWSMTATFAQLYYGGEDHTVPADQFITDAQRNTLPGIVFLTPNVSAGNNSEHSGASMTFGENTLAHQMNVLENSPAWASSTVFITYDDCGCFYDHVSPLRVPMVIAGPYVKAGYTDSTPTSFAGVIRYMEQTFGLPALNAKDANAYPYTDVFDYNQTPLAGKHLVTHAVPKASVEWLDTHGAAEDPDDS